MGELGCQAKQEFVNLPTIQLLLPSKARQATHLCVTSQHTLNFQSLPCTCSARREPIQSATIFVQINKAFIHARSIALCCVHLSRAFQSSKLKFTCVLRGSDRRTLGAHAGRKAARFVAQEVQVLLHLLDTAVVRVPVRR